METNSSCFSMFSIFHDSIQHPNFIMQSLRVRKWGWKGFLRQDFLNRRHICCYVKALKTHNGAVCPVGLVEQFGCQSLAFHQPGSGKISAVAGVAKQWNLTCYRVSHVWKPVRFFLLFLIGLSFRFQVLGTKYKHELLVDHPFSDLAGSCGNFPFLPLIPLLSPTSSFFGPLCSAIS